jgi:FtsZ-binding cell division protein ZapB
MIKYSMRICEVIKTIKPLTAQQLQIKSLQAQKEKVATQLRAERLRQQQQRAQERLRSAQAAVANASL